MSRDTKKWVLAFGIWGVGILIIYQLWYTRVFVNEAVETAFGFVLYVIAFFYALALFPIAEWIDGQLKPDQPKVEKDE
jgi:hypothetical protein